MRESLKAKALKHLLNAHPTVKRIGKVMTLKLCAGSMITAVKLRGENELVFITLNYVIKGNEFYITDVTASREWLNALADLFKKRHAKFDMSKYGIAANIVKHLF
ncbi:MAG: hypothetical protein FWE57_10205 [Chitinispirillia bacterium]|nr:hypothetical protein [Chitinispirillia bacterium]